MRASGLAFAFFALRSRLAVKVPRCQHVCGAAGAIADKSTNILVLDPASPDIKVVEQEQPPSLTLAAFRIPVGHVLRSMAAIGIGEFPHCNVCIQLLLQFSPCTMALMYVVGDGLMCPPSAYRRLQRSSTSVIHAFSCAALQGCCEWCAQVTPALCNAPFFVCAMR